MQTENPEKLKEWRHTAYMNRKMKKENNIYFNFNSSIFLLEILFLLFVIILLLQ